MTRYVCFVITLSTVFIITVIMHKCFTLHSCEAGNLGCGYWVPDFILSLIGYVI